MVVKEKNWGNLWYTLSESACKYFDNILLFLWRLYSFSSINKSQEKEKKFKCNEKQLKSVTVHNNYVARGSSIYKWSTRIKWNHINGIKKQENVSEKFKAEFAGEWVLVDGRSYHDSFDATPWRIDKNGKSVLSLFGFAESLEI